MYGIRLSRDLRGMKWKEFSSLMTGLSHETPLGRIASIRAENDPARLREFTPEMRRIRSEWQTRKAKNRPQKDVDSFLESMLQAFTSMAGGEKQ